MSVLVSVSVSVSVSLCVCCVLCGDVPAVITRRRRDDGAFIFPQVSHGVCVLCADHRVRRCCPRLRQ